MTQLRAPRKFRSSEYLEGIFQLAEELALDDKERTQLAERYQHARLLSGKTQRQLADDIGYTERTIGSYERGEPDQPLRVVQQWAKATGVRAEWLMTGHGDPVRDGHPAELEAQIEQSFEEVTATLERIEERQSEIARRLTAVEAQLAAPAKKSRAK